MSVLNKLASLIGLEIDDADDLEPEMVDDVRPQHSIRPADADFDDDIADVGGKKNKVVKIHTTAQLKLVVMQPESFEEARDIANHLKSKKPVVMNLEAVDRDVQRRIVDFLSGAVFALDGNFQKVSNGIFLIAPYNVGIMGDFKDELRNKGIFPRN